MQDNKRDNISKHQQNESKTYLGQDRFGNLQIRNVRKNAWGTTKQAAFLDHLAATCNVKMSARAVGSFSAVAYKTRRRDPSFAAAWDAALDTGYAALETMLIARAHDTLQRTVRLPIGETAGVPGPNDMTTEMAMKLLSAHRGTMNGKKNSSGGKFLMSSEDETNAAILKRLLVYKKRIDKELEHAGNTTPGSAGLDVSAD